MARILTILALTMAFQAQAATRVVLRNNSDLRLNAGEIAQTGAELAKGETWNPMGKRWRPGQQFTALSFNRDSGIKRGQSYFFSTPITSPDFPGLRITLHQAIIGRSVGSHLWQGMTVQGDEKCHIKFVDDRQAHTCQVKSLGRYVSVSMQAYYAHGHDNVEYIVHSPRPVPDSSGAGTLNVLAMNTYMRPTSIFKNGQWKRAKLLPYLISNYDVLILSELFDDLIRSMIVHRLSKNYPYYTKVMGRDLFFRQDGGVMIFSKWPMARLTRKQSQVRFDDDCRGSDCWSDKGVVYARIDKKGTPYHIFGSHTQAWRDDGEDIPARRRQLQAIGAFVKRKKIPRDQAVIIGGDLNVDLINQRDEYKLMLHTLRSAHPPIKGRLYTYDPAANPMGTGGRSEFLDYVLYSREHLAPKRSYNEVIALQSYFPWDKEDRDMSDHYPVFGHFKFD